MPAELQPEYSPVDTSRLLHYLGPQGPLAKRLKNYEFRTQQVEMARAVAEAFNSGQHFLVEAGTGTGKSLAYLLPALLWSAANRERVVVSTQTITLQEQLFRRDLPLLMDCLDITARCVVLKGRTNYLCLRKWRGYVQQPDLYTTGAELAFQARVTRWLQETETGDKEEANLDGEMEEFWPLVAADSESCPGARCTWWSQGCYLRAARQEAERANIIVVNHSLLFSDIKSDRQVLPPHRHLIVDEAHHLEDTATRHLSYEFDMALLDRSLAGAAGEGRGDQGLLKHIPDLARRAREAATTFKNLVSSLVLSLGPVRVPEYAYPLTLRITSDIRSGTEWAGLLEAGVNLGFALETLSECLGEVASDLEDLGDEDGARPVRPSAFVLRLHGVVKEHLQALDFFLEGSDPNYVSWVEETVPGGEKGRGEGEVRLYSAPVDVSSLLSEHFFQPLRTAVLTSATLTVKGNFSYLQDRLGLKETGGNDVRTLMVDSPFYYRDQVLLCLVEDAPNPRHFDPQTLSADLIPFLSELIQIVGGRTLVLFTSYQLLTLVHAQLKADCEPLGIRILGQGLDGTRTSLIEEIKSGRDCVVLGTSSFWEGIDIPGEELSCVVITRLPFSPPFLPVIEARHEHLRRRGMNPFAAYSLPEAIIRFKQGFGRLIRSAYDQGVVVVYDPRIVPGRTPYGRYFIDSLPGPEVAVGPRERILERVRAWLG